MHVQASSFDVCIQYIPIPIEYMRTCTQCICLSRCEQVVIYDAMHYQERIVPKAQRSV